MATFLANSTSPFALCLPPFALRLPPFALRLPPFALRLPPFALRPLPFALRSLPSALQLYFRYIGISFRSQMQYRASFIMLSAGQFLIVGVEFLAILVLFDRFGSLKGWKLPEIALFYGIVNLAFAVADAASGGFDNFGVMIKSGDFDRLLIRPRSAALQLAGQEITLRRVGRFTQAFIILLWAANALAIKWSLAKISLAIAAVVGGSCLFYGLIVLQATLAFWTTESLEIVNTVTYGGVEAAQFPIVIYPSWFRRFFIFVIPLACVSYFPLLAILERSDPLGSPELLRWTAPAVGVIFLLISLQVWKLGVRHYRSTGS